MTGKVLVLEDEVILGLALAEELEFEGFNVVGPFKKAADATEAVNAEIPDVAILDVNLGSGQTSFALAETLQNNNVPFLFLTGYSEVGEMKDRFPGVNFLSKPANIKVIVRQIRSLRAN